MILFLSATAAALVVGATPTHAASPGQGEMANADDCAVIAAVAREHYQFGPDNVAPPLRLDSDVSGWTPSCDWSRYGVSFPEIYGDTPDRPEDEGRPRIQWVEFKRPHYDGEGAVIEAGIVQGPRAGIGVVCRVRSGVAGWTVSECRNTWIS